MKFLVIGCGAIGQRYIRILKNLGHQVAGCEVDLLKAKQIREKQGIEIHTRLEEALKQKYDAALICTPTSLHVPVAIKAAKKNINLFIEKPLSHNLNRAKELSDIVRKKKLSVLVGCNTRFLPSFKQTKKLLDEKKIGNVLSVKVECGFYLPYWHPHEDYRKSYSASKSLGGGVILDDIHELDALHYLFGEVRELFCYMDKISNLEIDTEDIAEIFLKFKSGIIAQIHLDYLQRTYRRYYEFIGEKGIIIWDYISQNIYLYREQTNQWNVFQESINTNREIMFIEEMKYFMDCIKFKKTPVNDLDAAMKVVKVVLKCSRSAKRKRIVYL